MSRRSLPSLHCKHENLRNDPVSASSLSIHQQKRSKEFFKHSVGSRSVWKPGLLILNGESHFSIMEIIWLWLFSFVHQAATRFRSIQAVECFWHKTFGCEVEDPVILNLRTYRLLRGPENGSSILPI